MKADTSQISQTILALELGINERWNRGDVDGALAPNSEDVTYFDPLTETRLEGRKVVEAYFPQFFEGKRNILRNEIPNPQVIVSDDGGFAVLSDNLVNIIPDGQSRREAGNRLELHSGLSPHRRPMARGACELVVHA